MTNPHPKAFMSYSWDCQEHKDWVHELALRLRQDGVDVVLDRWHAVPGDQLPQFMESAIRYSDFVLIVCTPKYQSKSNGRQGGTGYEGDVMSAEIFVTGNQRKFLPLLRFGEWNDAAPSWLLGKYYLDFRSNPYEEATYQQLLDVLHSTAPPVPLVGSRGSSSLPANGAPFLGERSDGGLTRNLESLLSWRSEEVVAVCLTTLFGAAYWQINHLLHWSYGLSFDQIQHDRDLSGTGVGETAVDQYIGLAMLLFLAAVLGPVARARLPTGYFLATLIGVPILAGLLVGYWRDRPSPSAIAIGIMHGAILAILVMIGTVRRDLLQVLSVGDMLRDDRVHQLSILEEKARSGWVATIVAAVVAIACLIVMVAGVYFAPDGVLGWPVHPRERQLLALLFVIAIGAIFCEAVLLVWPRCMVLRVLAVRLQNR